MKSIGLKTIVTAGLIITYTVWLVECGKKAMDPVTRPSFLLNAFVTVALCDTEDQTILDGCMVLCSGYEKLLSKTLEGNEIYKLDHRRPDERTVTVLERTAQVLAERLEYRRMSRGAFGITIEPLSSLWNSVNKTPYVPPREEIEVDLKRVGYEDVILNSRQITSLNDEITIDLGITAKGSITDQMKTYLEDKGVEDAVINLGENVLYVGERPDGTPFKIRLQRPYTTHTGTVAAPKIDGVPVVSSGVYERHFMERGVNCHYTLDPSAGYPHENGLIQTSITSPGLVDGNEPSITCFTLGLEEGTRLIESMGQIYGTFLTEDGELHYTRGTEDFLYR